MILVDSSLGAHDHKNTASVETLNRGHVVGIVDIRIRYCNAGLYVFVYLFFLSRPI